MELSIQRILFSLTVAALGLVVANAEADLGCNNAVNFQGNIVTPTCQVDTGDDNKTVTLGNYATAIFKKVGDVTPDVPVTINLSHCGSTGGTSTFWPAF